MDHRKHFLLDPRTPSSRQRAKPIHSGASTGWLPVPSLAVRLCHPGTYGVELGVRIVLCGSLAEPLHCSNEILRHGEVLSEKCREALMARRNAVLGQRGNAQTNKDTSAAAGARETPAIEPCCSPKPSVLACISARRGGAAALPCGTREELASGLSDVLFMQQISGKRITGH